MPKTSSKNIVIRIDPELDIQSKNLLEKFGITQSGYIKMMLKKLVNTKKIDLDYSLDDFRDPTEEEIKIIEDFENCNGDFETTSFEEVKKILKA